MLARRYSPTNIDLDQFYNASAQAHKAIVAVREMSRDALLRFLPGWLASSERNLRMMNSRCLSLGCNSKPLVTCSNWLSPPQILSLGRFNEYLCLFDIFGSGYTKAQV